MGYKMVIEHDIRDGVYFARFPALPGCLAHGETIEEAKAAGERIRDEWIKATLEAGWPLPQEDKP